jgi:predicted  nucleic acid-binding Zn-ribbon protein
MIRKLLTDQFEPQQVKVLEGIYDSLKQIQNRLEEEVSLKQKTIEVSWDEIRKLRQVVVEKDQTITNLQNRILDCQRNIDGNRQLINKLLNDLERMKQDNEWYKRTYEKRTLFGVLKDRIKIF